MKKNKKGKKYWKAQSDYWEQAYYDVRRKWVNGEEPTWMDRMQLRARSDTPLLRMISGEPPIGKVTWGWSIPSDDADEG